MAHFIVIYAKLFESANTVFDQSPAKETVQKWRFTPENFDAIYGATL